MDVRQLDFHCYSFWNDNIPIGFELKLINRRISVLEKIPPMLKHLFRSNKLHRCINRIVGKMYHLEIILAKCNLYAKS
jgi:hypothetical protein